MMPGLGFTETILLVIVAIVVIGPKDLPLMMRKFGRFTGRMRALAFEFRQGFDELGRQAELDELRREVADLKQRTGLSDLERDMVNDAAGVEQDVHEAMTRDPSPTTASTPTIGPMAAAAAASASVAAMPDGALEPEPGSDPGPPEPAPDFAPEPSLIAPEPSIAARVEAPHEDREEAVAR